MARKRRYLYDDVGIAANSGYTSCVILNHWCQLRLTVGFYFRKSQLAPVSFFFSYALQLSQSADYIVCCERHGLPERAKDCRTSETEVADELDILCRHSAEGVYGFVEQAVAMDSAESLSCESRRVSSF